MSTPSGAVYDRGYRPYTGARGGRWSPVVALWRASMRRALGLRRSWRQKLLPWSLLAVVTIPAAVNVGIAYVTRDTPLEGFSIITYRTYLGVSSALLLFVALTAPDVVCPDRRHRALSLILARPVTGTGYALAKLAAIFTLVLGFTLVPQALLFVGQMLVSPHGAIDYVNANAGVLWRVPAAAVALALYYAALGVGLASLTGRRLVAGATFIGLLLVSSAVAGTLTSGRGGEGAGGAVNLLGLPLYVRDLIFLGRIDPGSPLGGTDGGGVLALGSYLGVVALSGGTLLARYRRGEA